MKSFFLLLIFCGLAWSAGAAIIIDSFSSAVNDRFANDPGFLAGEYDLSGVGISSDGRWATMVSPNVFLSANHFHPSTGATITFYESNNPLGHSVTRTVTSAGQRVGSTDLWIGTIDSALPDIYTYYDFATEQILTSAEFGMSPYAGQTAFLFGRSPSTLPTSQDMAVGVNVMDGWFNSVSTGGTTSPALVEIVNVPGDANFLTYEAYLQGGDSGGPIFDPAPGYELTLVGINWFIGSATTSEGNRNLNGQSYVGDSAAGIVAYIEAHAVPEPRVLILAAVFLAAGILQHHVFLLGGGRRKPS